MNKQLQALYATKEMLEKEWREGKEEHHWNVLTCPVCQTFTCGNCPFTLKIEGQIFHCVGFAHEFTGNFTGSTPIDETLSIIISMIQYYEENQ